MTKPRLRAYGWPQPASGPGWLPSSLPPLFFPSQMKTWSSRIVCPTMGCGLSMLCCFFSLVSPLGSAAKRLLLCKKAAYTHGPVDVDMQPPTPKPQGEPFLGGPEQNTALLQLQPQWWPADYPGWELVSNKDNWWFSYWKSAWLTSVLFLLLLFVLLWWHTADLSYWVQAFITI